MPIPIRRPKRITDLDTRIFSALAKAQRPLPVKQIALKTGVTWPTANLHVQKLAKLNVLTNPGKTIRKNRFSVNPIFIKHAKTKNIIKTEMDNLWGWLYD
jgi:predicted transcriptional regulator